MPDWLRRSQNEEDAPSIESNGVRVPIAIRRLAQSRRMTMRLAPDGSEVRIAMPQWAARRMRWISPNCAPTGWPSKWRATRPRSRWRRAD
jgi:hypothetical protein